MTEVNSKIGGNQSVLILTGTYGKGDMTKGSRSHAPPKIMVEEAWTHLENY
eukprot:COSAG01_NODE_2665_length_7288_cov_30.045208_7_plen_51_part_00